MATPEATAATTSRNSILVAEDSVVIQTVLRSMLIHWGYEVILAADGLDALHILEKPGAPSLAIVDWMMPGLQGTELCRRLRATAREPYTYVVLLTSRSDAKDIVEGLEAGADDYLTKPFHAQELRARIRAGSRIVRLQEELLAAREDLRERATFDDLTHLFNRASILDILHHHLERTEREGSPLSILLIDVDRFRQINESFGHFAGDGVLRECGHRIEGVAGASAIVGRYSGEEFLVVLPGMDGSAARELGARIQEVVAAESCQTGAASFPVTCSIGAATREIPGCDATTLLQAADEALLAAKAETRERLAGAMRASAAALAADRACAPRELRVTIPNLTSI